MRSRVRMMDISFLVFLLCFLLVVVNTAKTQPHHLDEECKPRSCNSKAPSVQFPFWLNNHQSQRCGFPGFRLSCNNNNQTELEIPRSVRLTVDRIDYKRQQIHVHDAENCLTNQIKSHNISSTPYLFQQYPYSYTLFNCSSTSIENLVPCLSGPGFQVRAVESDNMIYMSPLLSCKKVHDIALIPVEIVSGQRNSLVLNWINPKCGQCSREGKECRLKRYGTMTQAECYHKPKQGVSKVLIIGVPVGSFLSVLLATGIYFAVRVRNLDQREKENQVRIEKFLEDYKALRPTRYSYADIKRITNQFKKKLGQGAYGTVFKGKLSDDVFVAAKILNYSAGDGEEFINEVRSMGTIHHVNVTRLVGFCADGMKRALVYEFLPNNSLEKYIFSADGKRDVLGWEKLQDIALGIAKGIEYLHQGCDQRILHFDIKPHNILLDHNYNPKISDFGQAKLCSKEQSAVSMTAARGTMGYIAPEVLSRNFGNVSCKSDVYSYGMLLLEIVGGRKNVDDKAEGASQKYFPEWIYIQLMDQGEDLGIGIQEESHGKIARKLAVIGLYCIQWYPVERPSMSTVVQMLKGEGESLTIPPNPFASTDAVRTANNPSRNFQSELETIPESG